MEDTWLLLHKFQLDNMKSEVDPLVKDLYHRLVRPSGELALLAADHTNQLVQHTCGKQSLKVSQLKTKNKTHRKPTHAGPVREVFGCFCQSEFPPNRNAFASLKSWAVGPRNRALV